MMQLTKYEQANADDWACNQARQQMILELSECAIDHARETSILEVDAVDGKTEEASWCDNEEYKASTLSGETIYDRVHKWKRLEERVVSAIAQAHAAEYVSKEESAG